MTIKDWITFPRTEDGWPTKANAWMNDLVQFSRDLATRLTTAEADIVALESAGTYVDFTAQLFNFTGTENYSRVDLDGDRVHFYGRITLDAAPTGVMGIKLPYDPAEDNETAAGQVIARNGTTIYLGVPILQATGTFFQVQGVDDLGSVNRFWSSVGAVPLMWASGHTITWSFVYERA